MNNVVAPLPAPQAPATDQKRDNRRTSPRFAFRGASVPVRAATGTCEMRLKDLSRGGACGMLCEPLGVGDFVVIEFDSRHQVEAEVRWVRRFMVGLTFTHPLTRDFLDRMRELA